jgi:hypothetical protein
MLRHSQARAPLGAWVTGQRKDQSPATRADASHLFVVRAFGVTVDSKTDPKTVLKLRGLTVISSGA